MSSEKQTEELYELRVSGPIPAPEANNGISAQPMSTRNEAPLNESPQTQAQRNEAAPKGQRDKGAALISANKTSIRDRLPALDDDADVGVEKEHIVTRDGEADLRFTGVLLASAAPASAPKGKWREYRVYQTTGGKHVFSKVARSVFEEEEGSHHAEVFDPSPSSVPSQLLRSAREMARSKPLTWMDAATAYFGYDPLAKALYRKLSVRFEETIS